MRILVLALVLSVSVSAGCATTSAWWKDFTENPVTQTESILSIASGVQAVAGITFNQILPRIPVERRPDARKRFDHADMALTKAIVVVRDAVAAAAQAKEDKPDFTVALNNVTESIANIKAIISEVKGLVAAPVAMASAADAGAPVAAAAPEVDTSDLDDMLGRYEARVASE